MRGIVATAEMVSDYNAGMRILDVAIKYGVTKGQMRYALKAAGVRFRNRTEAPRRLRHGHAVVGKLTAEYRAWRGIIERCERPANKFYHRYGGRGIRVCARWRESYEAFFLDMGPRPSPEHSIDRIDNDSDYSPENCRWATRDEQQANRSCCITVVVDGVKMLASRVAKANGVTPSAFRQRMRRGWTIERALTP